MFFLAKLYERSPSILMAEKFGGICWILPINETKAF